MEYKEYQDRHGNRFLIPFVLGAALTAPLYANKCCGYNKPYYQPYPYYNSYNANYYVGPYNSFYRNNNESDDRYFVPRPFIPNQYYYNNYQYGYYSPQPPYFPTPYFPIGTTGSSNTFTGQFTGQFNRKKNIENNENIEDKELDEELSEERGNFYPLLNKYISSYLYPYFPVYCKNSPYCYYYGNPYYQSIRDI